MSSTNINYDAPTGWFLAGTRPFEYEATLDCEVFHSGSRSCRVECKVSQPSGWTTLMQNMSPTAYLGKRLRMTFWVRTKDVGYVSGWVRVDGKGKGDTLAFDNMCNRTIVDTQDWIKQEIVLDVPDKSSNIGFGVIFSGLGTMWADNFSFDVVDSSYPVTSCPCSRGTDHSAENLDFEED